jgi:hypothetical protein
MIRQCKNIINEVCYLYIIECEGNPIYVGSTSNIESREKSHIKKLADAYGGRDSGEQGMYRFLCSKNIESIKLKIVKTFENDVVIGNPISFSPLNNNNEGDNIISYTYEEKRFIYEEELIEKIFNKDIKLFNIRWPCKYDNNFVLRHRFDSIIPENKRFIYK